MLTSVEEVIGAAGPELLSLERLGQALGGLQVTDPTLMSHRIKRGLFRVYMILSGGRHQLAGSSPAVPGSPGSKTLGVGVNPRPGPRRCAGVLGSPIDYNGRVPSCKRPVSRVGSILLKVTGRRAMNCCPSSSGQALRGIWLLFLSERELPFKMVSGQPVSGSWTTLNTGVVSKSIGTPP